MSKLNFTKEEFEVLVYELLYKKPASFDMLCNIAEKSLRGSVNYWFSTDALLKGCGLEDDLMQEIKIRLIKTTVSSFMLKNGVDAPFNNDPEGFGKWMYVVALNVKRDYFNAKREEYFHTVDIADYPDLSSEMYEDDAETKREELVQAFSIVLDSNVSIYKILTWIAQFVFYFNYDITRIQSNRKMVEEFEHKTLYEMFFMIINASVKIRWLVFTTEQKQKILEELRKKYDENTVYGDVKYCEFFMKNKDGEKSGSKSISDWVNRMDNIIRRRMGKTPANKKD